MPQLIDLNAVSAQTLLDIARLTMDAEFAYAHQLTEQQRALFGSKEDFVEHWLSKWFTIKPVNAVLLRKAY